MQVSVPVYVYTLLCACMLIGLYWSALNYSSSFYFSSSDSIQYYARIEANRTREIALIYAYYEKNQMYKESFEYFLKNGILDDVDYYFVINGNCSVDIPERENIKVFQRRNFGFDFGAFSHGVKKVLRIYKYYFFMNTSVKGPYYPEGGSNYWPKYFIQLLSPENGTRLAGTSIYTFMGPRMGYFNLKKIYKHDPPFSHIQSMFFVMDYEAYSYLNEINFFDEDAMYRRSMAYTIAMKEIGLSQRILERGWNINSILPEYRGIDYRTLKTVINSPKDPYYPGNYFGGSIQPTDVIFFKLYRMLPKSK